MISVKVKRKKKYLTHKHSIFVCDSKSETYTLSFRMVENIRPIEFFGMGNISYPKGKKKIKLNTLLNFLSYVQLKFHTA